MSKFPASDTALELQTWSDHLSWANGLQKWLSDRGFGRCQSPWNTWRMGKCADFGNVQRLSCGFGQRPAQSDVARLLFREFQTGLVSNTRIDNRSDWLQFVQVGRLLR